MIIKHAEIIKHMVDHGYESVEYVTELTGVFFPGTMLTIKYPITLQNTSGVPA